MPHQVAVFRMLLMRQLDATHPRVVGRVAIFQVVDVVVRGDVAGTLDELIGYPPKALDLVHGEDIRDDDGADVVVFSQLGLGQHCVPPAADRPTMSRERRMHYPSARGTQGMRLNSMPSSARDSACSGLVSP